MSEEARLETLARDERAPRFQREEALDELLGCASRDMAKRVAEELLSSPPMRPRAVAVYARLAGRGALPRLVRMAKELPFDAETLVAICDALGALGGGHAQDALLALLGNPDEEVPVAAARALAECGTPAAVEPLLRYADGLHENEELRSAARQAADAIQGRLFDVGDYATVWEPAAMRLGLTFEHDRAGPKLRGSRGRIQIEVLGQSWRPGMDVPMRVVYRLSGGIPRGLRISSEREGGGEPEGALTTRGDEAVVTALLDSGCRGLLQAHPGILVRDGVLEVVQPGVAGAGQLIALVEDLVELAEALSIDAPGVPARLARNAAGDPSEERRFGALLALQQCFPDSPVAAEASRGALKDASARLRLAGARHLGSEGVEALLALARGGAPEEVRASALTQLLAHGPPDRTAPLLDDLLDDWSAEMRRASVWGTESAFVPAGPSAAWSSAMRRLAIPAYARLAGANAISRLASLASALDADGAASVTQALGRIGGPGAERALVELLAREEEDVQVASARALAACGSVAAVEPLLELSRGVLGRGNVRRAARDAVAAIQARAGAGAGRLSLAEPDSAAGRLSLLDGDGRLSLADEGEPRAE